MRPPIFICGTGRSGTTILQLILARHSRIFATRYEGRFIVSPGGLLELKRSLLAAPAVGRFKELLLGEWYQKVYRKGTPQEYVGGLHVDIGREELERLVADLDQWLAGALNGALRSMIEGFYGPLVQRKGKARWLEKTPTNLVYMPELYRLFPEAKFLHIIRDGRDVAVSIVRNFWPIGDNPVVEQKFHKVPRTIRNAARFWRVYLEKGLELACQLPPEAYKEIRLEQLIAEPEATLRDICAFIDEPFEQRLLTVPVRADRGGRWRQVFSEQDKADFKAEAGELLVRMGYAQDDGW